MAREILQYKSIERVFNSEFLWSFKVTKNSFIWWKRLINNASILISLTMKLIYIPALSAAAKCNWSHFRFIHNLYRNRLTNKCIFKLIFVYSYI